jgi:hypothetical protein
MHDPAGEKRHAAERNEHSQEELEEAAPVPPQPLAQPLDRSSHSALGGDAAGLVHGALIARPAAPALVGVGILVIAGLLACSGARPFTTKPVIWEDADRRPFSPKPEESFVPLYWDGADHIFFRPFARAWLLETGHPATNVNALDEVPDSSWFTNRIGRNPMTAEEVGKGPCHGPSPSEQLPWKVVGVKIDGANPGFQIKTSTGKRYVIKFDAIQQWGRASTGDVVGSRLYYAAGYQVPCNRVVHINTDQLELPAEEIKDPGGRTLTKERIVELMAHLPREKDGTVRAMASEFLPGKPLGPWDYSGKRGDDPNDVVWHEDRRELRGSRIIGAWVNHHDARSQNTLAMWADDGGGKGHVEHYIIDWGDTLGGLMDWDSVSRRVGYTYYIDFGQMALDFWTFGAVERPWERAHFGPAGPIWGYFDDAEFEPENWHVGYPNPAFSRMEEEDGAWMARILSHIDDAALSKVIDEAQLAEPVVRSELERILRGRRKKILERYLLRLSSLDKPELREGRQLCVEDRAEATGLGAAPSPSARLYVSANTAAQLPVSRGGPNELCMVVPDLGEGQKILDVTTGRQGQFPLRIWVLGGDTLRVVGLDRPRDDQLPPPT